MAFTKFQICSRALTRIGANPISSFDDSSAQTESRVAGREWDQLIETLLTEHKWKFATREVALNHLTTVPNVRYTELWQLPSAMLDLHGIFLVNSSGDDIPIPYERLEDRIACDYDETHTLYARYTFNADTTLWPPYFVEMVTEGLEAIFTGAIRRDTVGAEKKRDRWEKITKPRTKNLDSQGQTSRGFPPSRLVSVRR